MSVLQFNYSVSNLKQIAAGGEGTIYEIDSHTVLKFYHAPKNVSYIPHLESLASLPDCFLKPIDVYSTGSKVLGFTMKYVDFRKFFILNDLFNKSFCVNNNIDAQFKIDVLEKIRVELELLHKKDIVVGDLNQYNIFFSIKKEIIFVDVDSYQTPSSPHSNVLLEDIQDFSNVVSKRADMWSHSILSFWATSYVHPFKWIKKKDPSKLMERVKAGRSFLTEPDIIIPKLYEAPTGRVKDQFLDIFNKGRRFFIDYSGTVIQSNISHTLLVPSSVISQKLSAKLLHTGITDIYGNSERVIMKRPDSFTVLNTNVKGFTSVGDEFKEQSYCGKQLVLTYFDNLVGGNKAVKNVFLEEYLSYYYDTGFVAISKEDMLHCFDIDTQLSTVYNNSTPVFSKSFSLRDSLFQNFGKKKFLVLPRGININLVEIPLSTKNAYCNSGYSCVEYLENKNTKFMMLNLETKTSFEVDYYSYFTANKNTVFIPDEGLIKVYSEGIFTTELDLDICTRNSKLIFTTSGILLLEDKSLYLLNTK